MNIFVTVQTALSETSSHSICDEIQKVGEVIFLAGKMTPGDKEAQVFHRIESIGAKIGNHHATMPINVRGDRRQLDGLQG